MKDVEHRFKQATNLRDRSQFKIFYCQVHPAPILTLGINPGGDPANTNADGRTHKDGVIAASSAGYFENDEHDVLDCEWKENFALRRIFASLFDGDVQRIRHEVVKTNLAFRRSAKAVHIDINSAISESAPFLSEIIEWVRPKLVVLTGVRLDKFADRFAGKLTITCEPIRDPGVKQTVFASAIATLRRPNIEVNVVQLAHASQFGWTYKRYGVADKMKHFLVT